MSGTQSSSNSNPGLKRVLGLSSLVLYGIIVVQPTAPMPLFGAAVSLGHGHAVTTVLIGMVAMLFTAISYGRMANAYPSAGSAYTYVSREIHPALGYVVGWGMIFDYVMNPIICVIWVSKAAMNLIPQIPFPVYAIAFTVLFTAMNLRGIEASSRTNSIIITGLGIVILIFIGAAVRYLFLHPPANTADWTRPFYDPETFSFSAVSAGASLAVLTYFGFDSISTLSEEVHNPRRNILLATVLVCIITGVLASIQVYAAQLVWPGTSFPDQDTAFCFVAGKAGGQWLFLAINLALIVGTIGAGSGAHLGAGRLLYAMGRDNAIPYKFFGVVNPRTHIPSNNIILVGVITLFGAFLLTFPLGAQFVNFGALIAFMGVNISSFVCYFLRNERKTFGHFIVPVLGFLICLYLWLSLGYKAKIAGMCWLTTGILYGAYRTSWFRKPLQFVRIENNDES
jgi:amino acid transporter